MPQVSARLPKELITELDWAASRLQRSRTAIIRQAFEYRLEDLEDLRLGLERLQHPADPVPDWEDVKTELLDQD